MATGTFSMGPNKWTPTMGSCEIEYDSSGEFTAVKANGRNDARQNWQGRINAVIVIKLKWKDDSRPDSDVDGEIDTMANNFLAEINPRGKNGGKAWQWSERDQEGHNVYDVTVANVKTTRPVGTFEGRATIKLYSWVKPVAQPNVSKTPKTSGPWAPGGKTKTGGAPKQGFTQSPVKVNP